MITLGTNRRVSCGITTDDGRRWTKTKPSRMVSLWRCQVGGRKRRVHVCLPFTSGEILRVSVAGVGLWDNEISLHDNILQIDMGPYSNAMAISVLEIVLVEQEAPE